MNMFNLSIVRSLNKTALVCMLPYLFTFFSLFFHWREWNNFLRDLKPLSRHARNLLQVYQINTCFVCMNNKITNSSANSSEAEEFIRTFYCCKIFTVHLTFLLRWLSIVVIMSRIMYLPTDCSSYRRYFWVRFLRLRGVSMDKTKAIKILCHLKWIKLFFAWLSGCCAGSTMERKITVLKGKREK